MVKFAFGFLNFLACRAVDYVVDSTSPDLRIGGFRDALEALEPENFKNLKANFTMKKKSKNFFFAQNGKKIS